MDLGIRGKSAIVAGGSRGSGFAIAKELALEGAKVLLTGRESHFVRAAEEQLSEMGEVAGLVADMSTPDGVRSIVKAASDQFGAPEILVVNPRGSSQARSLNSLSDADLRDAFDVFVMSLAWFARATIPAMVERQWGRIVVMGSVGMKSLHLDDTLYAQNLRGNASAFLKTLSHEYGRYGITANSLAIGPIQTAASSSYMEGEGAMQESHLLDKTGMKRWGRPDEVAALTAFLVSDRAGYITGETIRIDGNYSHSLF